MFINFTQRLIVILKAFRLVIQSSVRSEQGNSQFGRKLK